MTALVHDRIVFGRGRKMLRQRDAGTLRDPIVSIIDPSELDEVFCRDGDDERRQMDNLRLLGDGCYRRCPVRYADGDV